MEAAVIYESKLLSFVVITGADLAKKNILSLLQFYFLYHVVLVEYLLDLCCFYPCQVSV